MPQPRFGSPGTGRTVALIAGAVALATAAVAWAMRQPTAELRLFLSNNVGWALELQLALAVAGALLNARGLLRTLSSDRVCAGAAAAASLAALLGTTFVAPRTNRIYYDEHIYESVGQSLADAGRATMCSAGYVEYGTLRCERGDYNKEPAGYPVLLSIGYRLFGTHEWLAFALNNVAAALLPLLVFAAGTLLYKDARAGAIGAWAIALIPQLLRWSNTAAVEPSATLASAVAVVSALWFWSTRRSGALAWAAAATAFAASLRPESILIVVVVVAMFIHLCPEELLRPRAWVAAAVGLLLLVPALVHMIAVGHESWGATGPRLGLMYVRPNLAVNGPFYLNNQEFPAVVTGLAVIALLGRAQWRAHLVAVEYFLLTWVLFLFFYAGSYHYGADVRYSLLTYPPLAIVAGAGGARVTRWLDARRRGPHGAYVGSLLIWLLLVQQASHFAPLVRAVGEESWGARGDVESARGFARQISADSLVLTHNPSLFLLWGRNAAQIGMALADENYLRAFAQQRPYSTIYFHWNFWCNVADPVQTGMCEQMLRRYPATLVSEQKVRSYRYALYRLDTAPWHPPAAATADR